MFKLTDIAAVPHKEPLRREWVKFQLRARGASLSQVARELGLVRSSVAQVFLHPYPRMERAVAKRLGLRPEQIWPERYDEQGKPNRPRTGRPKKSNTDKVTGPRAGRNVHTGGAA